MQAAEVTEPRQLRVHQHQANELASIAREATVRKQWANRKVADRQLKANKDEEDAAVTEASKASRMMCTQGKMVHSAAHRG